MVRYVGKSHRNPSQSVVLCDNKKKNLTFDMFPGWPLFTHEVKNYELSYIIIITYYYFCIIHFSHSHKIKFC